MLFARKSLTNLLAMVPMALIVHIGAATAASPASDRAEELRTLLSGIPAATSAHASAARSPNAARSVGDAQQQARDVVLAISARTPSTPRSYASKPGRERVRSDAQTQAQEVILGRVGVSKAGA